MKLLVTFALALTLVPPLAGLAQTLTNDGAALTVRSGTVLYVAGDVLNKADGTLINNGTVQLTGHFTNAATATSLGGTGQLLFSGTQDQVLTSPAGTTLANLQVANTGAAGSNHVLVPNALTVTGTLSLASGLLRTTATATGTAPATLTLPEGATLTGEAPGRYVQGSVRVLRNSGSGVLDFGNGAVLDRTGLGNVAITRTAGLQTAGVSYGTNLAATNRGIDRVWTVAADVPPTAPVALTLNWLPENDNGFVPGTDAQLWRGPSAAGPWGKTGAPASAASRSFAASISELGAFTISNVTAPLPVELTHFTAEPLGADVLLRWATASEKNNDYFEVESSTNGQAFKRIGRVAGQGSSTAAHEYHLTDPGIARYAAHLVYYCLRQVDKDGTAAYSPVRTVRVAAPTGLSAAAWPLPFGSEGATLLLRTASAGPTTLLVYDALGRPVLSRTLVLAAGTTALSLVELGPLATGIYMLRLMQGREHATIKLVRE